MAKASRSKTTKQKKPKKSVASKSRPSGRKKAQRSMNEKIVKQYVVELAKALGNKSFDEIFCRLREDAEVKQAEAISITAELLQAKVASSTARGTALGRILKLHNSLKTFKLKQRAVGGRSAA